MFAPVFQVNVQVTISLVTICIGAEVVMRLVPRSFDVLAPLTPVFYREPAAALCGGFAALTGPCIQPPVIATTGVPLYCTFNMGAAACLIPDHFVLDLSL